MLLQITYVVKSHIFVYHIYGQMSNNDPRKWIQKSASSETDLHPHWRCLEIYHHDY